MISKGTRILVTGATGFIGGRLVERLVSEYGADVRALVRNFARAPRIARFAVRMLPGEVTQPESIDRAIEGCEIVFHCAYGNAGSPSQQRAVTVEGTQNVLEAALKHKVRRILHVSTVSVYGRTADGDLDESAPHKHSGEVYADSKLEAEDLVFKYFKHHGLPVSVVQPTVVYGPYGGTWTMNPISQLKTHRLILVNGESGLCNAVYVDDVVQAMLLASIKEEAIGQAFLISGEQPVTWHEFYNAYERMLGFDSTVSLSKGQIEDMRRRLRKKQGAIGAILPYLLSSPAVARPYLLGRRLIPGWLRSRLRTTLLGIGPDTPQQIIPAVEKPILLLTEGQVAFFEAHTRVRIDKAERMLGYKPVYSFEKGMGLTETWARYSNLL